MEFKASKDENGQIVVHAVAEKVGNDIIMHVPSFQVIEKLVREEKRKEGDKDYGFKEVLTKK